MKSFRIVPLGVGDSLMLSRMLTSSSEKYQKHFVPFSFDVETIRRIIIDCQKDRYWGIWLDTELAGFFMLRGLDEGFSIPSYGVSIAERYSGYGLMRCSLHVAVSWCRLNEIETLMLKVHPDNVRARDAYEKFGFKPVGFDKKNNNLIYHYTVPK